MSMDEKYPLALSEGTILAGQYVIEKVLGQGGFGITYRATDHKTNQKVAIKEFFPDTLAYRERTSVISYPGERSENYAYGKESFLQEAKTLAEFIGNENIVRIHSYFEENGTAYFVMDYIEGKSFDEFIKEKGGKISVEEAKNILVPVMDALGVVHSRGIVHRDVTPDNIYITSDGTVKLLDFGAARYSLGDKSRSLDVILKHGFAPKEQYTRRGKQGAFTDIYSLGATFYFAITGKRPPDSVDRLDEDDLIPPSNLGVSIADYQERAILQAMNVQPAERFQSMAEFKKILLNESTVTNQIFFTAPDTDAAPPTDQVPPVVQQIPPTAQQADQSARMVQAAQSGQANQSVQADQKPEILKNKKLIIGLSAACGVFALVIAFFVGSAFSNKNNDKMSSTGSDNWGDSSQSSGGYVVDVTPSPSTFELPTLEPFTTEPATPEPATPEPATPEPVAYDVSELTVLGNTASNIKNFGIVVQNEGKLFFIDDELHSLYSKDDGCIYENQEGLFSCLSYYNGILYFLYDGKAYMRDMTDGSKEKLIPELKSYGGNIERLYVTTGYYFIYSDGGLCRISRKTGEEEEWKAISSSENIAFGNDDWIFYIDNDVPEGSAIQGIAPYDFDQYTYYYVYPNSGYYSEPIVDGDYIYVLWSDDSTASIEKMHIDYFLYGDDTRNLSWDISDLLNEGGQSDNNEVLFFNLKENIMFFSVFNSMNNSVSLYEVVVNQNESDSYDTTLIGSDFATYPCILDYEGYFEVWFIMYDEDEGKNMTFYRTYD